MEGGHEFSKFSAEEFKAICTFGGPWNERMSSISWPGKFKAIGLEGHGSWGHEFEFLAQEMKAIGLEDVQGN